MKPADYPFTASAIITLLIALIGWFAFPLFIRMMDEYVQPHIVQISMLIPLAFIFLMIHSTLLQMKQSTSDGADHFPRRIDALTKEISGLAEELANATELPGAREAARKLEAAAARLCERLTPVDASS